MVKIDKKWWKSTKNGENRQKMVLLPSKMVLPPSKMVLPQAMAWVQYWFRVLSLKFGGKSKKIGGDLSPVSPAFCMYDYTIKSKMMEINDGEHSNKCNQCEYSSSNAGTFRRHLKKHSGVKSNKCNQCDFASSQAGDLRRHLKTHSGEKANKCNQCEYKSSEAGNLRRHLKTHGKSQTKATPGR